MKKLQQFEIIKLYVINKIKCLILEIVENYEKLNFILRKKQKSHTPSMFGMNQTSIVGQEVKGSKNKKPGGGFFK